MMTRDKPGSSEMLMMEPERRPLTLITSTGDIILGDFLLWDESPELADGVRLAVRFEGEEIARDADDFFSALRSIRSYLEMRGLIPRCHGASRKVYPSGMSQDMGTGDKAYRLALGRQGQTDDLVNIFEDGPDVEPVLVEVQERFHREWLESLSYETN